MGALIKIASTQIKIILLRLSKQKKGSILNAPFFYFLISQASAEAFLISDS